MFCPFALDRHEQSAKLQALAITTSLEGGCLMKRYGWAQWGDVNAFFGLMLDNLAVMVLLVTLISRPLASQETGDPKFTPEFVMARMIPGTALGVLVGDLI